MERDVIFGHKVIQLHLQNEKRDTRNHTWNKLCIKGKRDLYLYNWYSCKEIYVTDRGWYENSLSPWIENSCIENQHCDYTCMQGISPRWLQAVKGVLRWTNLSMLLNNSLACSFSWLTPLINGSLNQNDPSPQITHSLLTQSLTNPFTQLLNHSILQLLLVNYIIHLLNHLLKHSIPHFLTCSLNKL